MLAEPVHFGLSQMDQPDTLPRFLSIFLVARHMLVARHVRWWRGKENYPESKSSQDIKKYLVYLDYLDCLGYLVLFFVAELDGNVFYYIDPCYAMERQTGKAKIKYEIKKA